MEILNIILVITFIVIVLIDSEKTRRRSRKLDEAMHTMTEQIIEQNDILKQKVKLLKKKIELLEKEK